MNVLLMKYDETENLSSMMAMQKYPSQGIRYE